MEDTFSFTQDDSYNKVNNMVLRVKNEIHKVIIGQEEMIDLMLAGIFSGGHVLLEGVPGIAKTVTAKTLAKTLAVYFNRIQFTPDLMPTDVIGTTIFNVKTSEFQFNKGPIFSNIVLIDEINRSPAKTQAALFEVMEEKQITVDGVRHVLQFPFFVIATQNPIEQEGTYKLPEAQLDRFIFKIKLSYPSFEEEKRILRRFKEDFTNKISQDVAEILNFQDLQFIAEHIEKIHIEEHLLDYIGQIVFNTRNHPDLYLGASPRASLAILKTSKAIAAMRGRSFVIPEDIQYVAYPVLNHRIILTPEKEMEGDTTESVIKSIIEKIEVPR
ncbi:MAG: AAA family ATPase [Cytophaga sp.]|uniref:AAA family ATPase n=1 Tax=Cytophaga sp. TaxID=29535 RepID=UPI003F810C9C